MAKSQHLHLKNSTSAKAIPRRSQNGPERRSWDEETDEAQVPMYQPNQNFRELQAAIMGQHQEHIKHLKPDRRYREEATETMLLT